MLDARQEAKAQAYDLSYLGEFGRAVEGMPSAKAGAFLMHGLREWRKALLALRKPCGAP